ncbi:hypothetical protein ACS0TY_018145 [Phlomoides rotata]
MIIIASLKSKLSSGDDEYVLQSLERLKDLCEEREIHKEWVIVENWIPTLVDLIHERIVRISWRRIGEQKSAVALLLELSKCESIRDGIAKVQGCILLL